jgi:hypothetical protein
MDAYIGIDLGTTRARSAVYGEDFAVLGESFRDYPLLYPGGGWVEQDATLWWELTALTLREALMSETCLIKVADALGHISAETVCFCPPGIPKVAAGEIIDGFVIEGLKKSKIAKIKVVK